MRDVHGSEVVSESSSATPTTGELSLRDTIRLRDKATGRTGTRSVAGVNRNTRDACERSFVIDEASELLKGPSMMLTPLSMPNRRSLSDAFEVFNGNAERVPSGLIDQGLADGMIHPGAETLLLSPSLFREALGGLCALLLKFLPEPCMAVTEAVQVSARVDFPITVHHDVEDTHIHSQEALWGDGFGAGNFDRLMDVDPSVPLYQHRVNGLHGEDNPFSRLNGQAQAIEAQFTVPIAMPIERQATSGEGRQAVAPCGIAVTGSDAANQRQSEGGRKPEGIPNLMVGAVDQRDTAEDALLEGDTGDVVADSSATPYHVGEGLGFTRSRNLRGDFHGPLSITESVKCIIAVLMRAAPPVGHSPPFSGQRRNAGHWSRGGLQRCELP